MKKLRRLNLIHLALKCTIARKILILLFILSSIPFFAASNACASFPNGGPDFGWVLIGTNKCADPGTYFWKNLSPGNTFMCDSDGCGCSSSEVQRTATFTTSGNGFSVMPSGPISVTGCTGIVNLSVCVSPSAGDYYGTLTATVSPSFNDGSTTQSTSLHVKGIPSLVTAEPLGSSLNFGSAEVGQTITKTFSVCNYNSSSVTINSISINNNNFTVASGVNVIIPPVQDQYTPNCSSVGINFSPQTTGAMNATIQVNTTAQNPTYTCSGNGTLGPTVTPSAGANGSISPNTPQSVTYNGTTSFTVTPNSGYTIASVTGCGGTLSGNTYTTGPITSNCTVSATFASNFNIVTPSAGTNGSISPNTPQSVAYNRTTSFTVTPNSGYYASVTGCSGTLSGNTYTTGPITGDCTVSATFASGSGATQGPAFSIPGGIFLVVVGLGIILWRRRKENA